METNCKRKDLEILRATLDQERSSFISHWRDIGDHVSPRRGRWMVSDANKGDRRNQRIIDSTGTLALRTLKSGMMSGITSPARPWFRLTHPDPQFAEFGAVKEWLHIVSERMTGVFLKSNLYNALPTVYGDLGGFGTAALFVEEDFDEVVRFYAFPIGSYMIALNDRLKVDVFVREFRMTVRQLVKKFGKRNGKEYDWSNFSQHVQDNWKKGNHDVWIDVVHVIKPNDEYDEKKLSSKHKRYASKYYEKGSAGSGQNYMEGTKDLFLREAGYDFFPVLCPRWETTGEDIYGTNCPGMEALGDVKQLQLGEKRIHQAIEKMINPPMTAPTSLRGQSSSILPGDITFVDTREGQQGFRPAHEINPRIVEMENKQMQVRERVRRAFFEDLFLMLSQSDRREITAREIDERREEKLLALGPVLEQLNQDLLDPLIDITFDIMTRQGLIPEPPEELRNVAIKVEYISIMAQAQKLIGISGMERFMGFAGQLAQFNPEVVDKIDFDQALDVYGEMTSVAPGVVRSDDKVNEIRSAKQKAMQQQMQAQTMRDVTGSIKDLSGADMEGDNALTRLMDQAQAGSVVEGL